MPPRADRPTDPYRTLGLEPGASMAEVKRAYRQLAKAFHPDSAGEAALPRFLAIHEAYERIRTGRLQPGSRQPWSSGSAAAGAEPWRAEPWRADPARAQAARERARRPRGSSPAGGTTPPRARPDSASGGPPGATGTNSTGPGSAAGRSASGGSGRRRYVRKATLGSTSYDDAREHHDATWSGASWYGPTTGEYWIINPREYADPRKHGPAYQARARAKAEAAAAAAAAAATAADVADGGGADDVADHAAPSAGIDEGLAAARAAAGAAASAAAPAATPMEEGTARARPGAGSPPGDRRTWSAAQPAAAGMPHDPDAPQRQWAAPPTASRPAPEPLARWLGEERDDPIRRLGLALVAWPPLGIAAALAIGEATGCSDYAASCAGVAPILPWLAQAILLGLLLLLPFVARALATASIAVVVALFPVTAVLIALGAQGHPAAGPTLAILLGSAWLVGLAYGVATDSRRRTRRAAP